MSIYRRNQNTRSSHPVISKRSERMMSERHDRIQAKKMTDEELSQLIERFMLEKEAVYEARNAMLRWWDELGW